MTSTRPLLQAVIALAITVGLVASGTSAQAVSAPKGPRSPCGDLALVLQDAAPVDLYDLNRDGWHCSGPRARGSGGTAPVRYADNTRIPKPKGAITYFAGGVGSGLTAWLSTKGRPNRYTANVSIKEGGAAFRQTFRYDKNDLFYLSYGDESSVGGSRLVTLKTFQKALAAAAVSPYFRAIELDALYSPRTAVSSVFSLHTAADESPAVNDVAKLRSGKVTQRGDISVSLSLTCPKASPFTALMFTLTVGSGAPDDIMSTNRGSEATGTCTGKRQTITLLLITEPIGGVLYPPPRNCSAEYQVTIAGPAKVDNSPRWTVGFDRGGADGGPDGPGPMLCLT